MKKLTVNECKQLSAVSLAFVGDAVFSLYIRERLTLTYDFKSGKLSFLTSKYVNAGAQSKMLETLLPLLSQDETDIVKNARNAHTNHKAKNSSMSSYKRATGLEGLIGFLYLTGQQDRLEEIFEICFKVIDNESNGQS